MAVRMSNKKAMELVIAMAIAGRPFAETTSRVTQEDLDEAIKRVREIWVRMND